VTYRVKESINQVSNRVKESRNHCPVRYMHKKVLYEKDNRNT